MISVLQCHAQVKSFQTNLYASYISESQTSCCLRIQSAWRGRRRRGFHLFRKPHAGGQQLAIPLKCGYQYRLTGADTTTIAIDQDIGLQYMVSEWYTRYSALFQWIRINKCRIEISCPYNIGQHDVSAGPLRS